MINWENKTYTLQATLAPGGYLFYNLDADMAVIGGEDSRYILIAEIPVVPPFIRETKEYLEWNY